MGGDEKESRSIKRRPIEPLMVSTWTDGSTTTDNNGLQQVVEAQQSASEGGVSPSPARAQWLSCWL